MYGPPEDATPAEPDECEIESVEVLLESKKLLDVTKDLTEEALEDLKKEVLDTDIF